MIHLTGGARANFIAVGLVIVTLVGVWYASLGTSNYAGCNEKRRSEYVAAEVRWFNALDQAEKRRFNVSEHEYTRERNEAYDQRAASLEASLREKC